MKQQTISGMWLTPSTLIPTRIFVNEKHTLVTTPENHAEHVDADAIAFSVSAASDNEFSPFLTCMSEKPVRGCVLDELNPGIVKCRPKRAPPAVPARLPLGTPTTSRGFTETLRLTPSEENFQDFEKQEIELKGSGSSRVLQNLCDAHSSMEKSLANLAKYRNTEFLNLAKFNKLMECQLCGNFSIDQRALMCGHSFCLACLECRMESTKAVQPDSENETRVECAQCGLSTKLSLSVRDLPMDPLIALYSAVPSQHMNDMTLDEIALPNCDICPENVSSRGTHKCIECSDWLCSECALFHCRTKLTRGHMVLTMEQIKTGKHDEEIRSRAKVFCQEHPSEETKLFCLDCNKSVCQFCSGHQRHKEVFVKDAMAEKLAEFETSLADVHRKAELLRAELKHMTRIEEQLVLEKNKALRESQTIAQDAHSAIDSWLERIVAEIDSQYNHDLDDCKEKREVLTSRDRQLRRCGDFISRVVQIGTPNEIIQLQRARNAIDSLLSNSNIDIPSNSTIYHVNHAERLMDIDLGTFEVVPPEISNVEDFSCETPTQLKTQTVELKRPDSIHSSGSDSGITEEPPRLPPKNHPKSVQLVSAAKARHTRGVPFEPTSFCLYGDKLALTYEDSLVLASPIDGHILKRVVDGGIARPTAITSCYKKKELFVFDSSNQKITIMTENGRFLSQLSTAHSNDTTLPQCSCLIQLKDELLMLDSANNSIKIFTSKSKGSSFSRILHPSGLDEISGMTLSPDNNLYISNCWTQSILKVDQNTSETAILADRNCGLDFPKIFRFFNDRLIVAEEFSSTVKIFVVEECTEDSKCVDDILEETDKICSNMNKQSKNTNQNSNLPPHENILKKGDSSAKKKKKVTFPENFNSILRRHEHVIEL
ncbi:Oidioi.mRNA.OKI2018_I69.XSR.g13537.t1.cds [Oikopleura dioica]|uniref:RING-type E3 ubiquitin transferase n=1 Tax=Oikopleura dioica TaxID=34765 RepID=A0ABN7SAW7_OIKDI|nr:Oidioi.mRNA.OKI2018_I69.XSR.g13537.t1.cds [Oikopleura dioica]